MADFQGKYNGDQIEQLLDKANDIDLTKYALKTDNAPTATKLQAARTIALSGAVTGSAPVSFGSVMNNGLDRTLELEITTPKGVKKTLTVNQEGCRQAYITSDGKRWLTSDNRVYGVLKSDAPCECIGDCP